MKFYKFRQNNSGGSFDVNADVTIEVYIEAEDVDMANIKAQEIGIYFDGCNTERDCPCCGDRWEKASESNSFDNPMCDVTTRGTPWVEDGECYMRIYFNDGMVGELIK